MSDTKTCVICGAAFTRRPRFSRTRFANQTTCSHACSSIATVAKRGTPAFLAESKVCETCGSEFSRRDGERRRGFRDRKHCSDACRYAFPDAAINQPRTCVVCAAPLFKRVNESGFAKRQTCGGECQSELRKRTMGIESPKGTTCKACNAALIRRPGELAWNFRKRVTCDAECLKLHRSRTRRHEHEPLLPKTCVVCGVTFAPPPGSQKFNWKRRETCSRKCAIVQTTINRGQIVDDGQQSKPCVVCGAAFQRTPDMYPPQWRAKKTCSPECARISFISNIRKQVPEKACISCGLLFERRANESVQSFRSRRTCGDRDCVAQVCRLIRWKRLERTDPYPPEFYRIRQAVLKRDGGRCRLCGESAYVTANGKRIGTHVHHINYQKFDCRMDNLISLCRTCHIKTNSNRRYWQGLFEGMMALELDTAC